MNIQVQTLVTEYRRTRDLRNQASRAGDIQGVYGFDAVLKYWTRQLKCTIENGTTTWEEVHQAINPDTMKKEE